jgi:homoisocitrate dehydrogenase
MKLCIIPGDGIGPEVIGAVRTLLDALPLALNIVEATAGWNTFQATGTALPDATLDAAQQADAVFFGAVASPSYAVPGYRSPIVALRRALDLYANIRPVRSLPATSSGGRPDQSGHSEQVVDLVVVRENTEGLYAGRERLEDDGATAIAERVITRRSSQRIVRKAFELARERGAAGQGKGLVTLAHKANVLRVSDGLFREAALEVAREYPDIQIEEVLIDTAAMRVAQVPERFDVIVTTNMFGDILSDVACIHGGGLGLASSANLGEHYALFEPVHGAAPDIAGQGIANPLAAFGCVVLWLQWAAANDAEASDSLAAWARRVQDAIGATLRDGPHTPDLGGSATTGDITAAIIQKLT